MTALHHLRRIALLEGASFLVLLFVAMPLKYFAGMPLAVRIAGSIHGLLFLIFLGVLYHAATEHRWSYLRSLGAFVCALVPFGPFVLDRSLRREIANGA